MHFHGGALRCLERNNRDWSQVTRGGRSASRVFQGDVDFIWGWEFDGRQRAFLFWSCQAGSPRVLGWQPTPGHTIRVMSCLGRAKIACFRAGRRAAGQMTIYICHDTFVSIDWLQDLGGDWIHGTKFSLTQNSLFERLKFQAPRLKRG
jgi:hypothetical protein